MGISRHKTILSQVGLAVFDRAIITDSHWLTFAKSLCSARGSGRIRQLAKTSFIRAVSAFRFVLENRCISTEKPQLAYRQVHGVVIQSVNYGECPSLPDTSGKLLRVKAQAVVTAPALVGEATLVAAII